MHIQSKLGLVQSPRSDLFCFSTGVDVWGSWLWGPPWGGLHRSHPHSRVSFWTFELIENFHIDQSISGGGWALHHVSRGCGEDKDASSSLQHPQVPKQVNHQKHPVHDAGGGVLAACSGGAGHGIGSGPSACLVLPVLWDDEREASSQIQAGNFKIYCSLNNSNPCSGGCSWIHTAPVGWLWCNLLPRLCDVPGWGRNGAYFFPLSD